MNTELAQVAEYGSHLAMQATHRGVLGVDFYRLVFGGQLVARLSDRWRNKSASD